MKRMYVTVDRSKCIMAGQCLQVAPGLFDQDEDGIVVLLRDRFGEDERRSAELAAGFCPARAIRVEAEVADVPQGTPEVKE
jgi:ferredoxin